MKRIFPILLILLLLCGCQEQQVEQPTTPTQTQPTEYVEPEGIYDAASQIESQTGGAVRAYPLDVAAAYNLEAMGTDLVVFSGDSVTTLTCLAGENLYLRSQVELPFRLEVRPSTQVTGRGISYVDPLSRQMVFLDAALKEVSRFDLPEGLIGEPLMSANRQILYYCTADSVRALDLETGISRLIKQITYSSQTLEALLLSESIAQCSVTDDHGNLATLFISTETGQTLGQTGYIMDTVSIEDRYFTKFYEGNAHTYLFGAADGGQSQLVPGTLADLGWFLKEIPGVVTVSGFEETCLDFYHLESGLRTASVTVDSGYFPWCVAAGSDGTYLWFLCDDPTNENETVCRWDLNATPVQDDTVYTGPRFTEANPDNEALAQCFEYAEQLSARYGVRILIGSHATEVQPWDYTLETEYHAPVVQESLEKLELILSQYPEGFFLTAAEGTQSGKLNICIVRSLRGTPESGSLNSALGLQFWIGEEAYLAVAAGDSFHQTFYHEMFHIIETLVYIRSKAYDDWDKLNPKGFNYDYDFAANAIRQDDQYLQDENRAFIDMYSMSFPKEDRARIMEYAMMSDNGHYFQSATMQQKLRTLCIGIREAFGLKKSPDSFLWEQYLEESLAYTKK